MTTPFSAVPVIDVHGLLHGPPEEVAVVAAELGRAASDVGFLYVTGHGVPTSLYGALLQSAQRLFSLPLEQKMAYYIGLSACHRGYVPEGEEVFGTGTRDLKEAFDLGLDLSADDPDVLAGNPLLGPNTWPDLPDFADVVTAWYDAVLSLGRHLLHGFAVALGQPADVLDAHVTKPPSQLRLIHYPHDPEAQDVVGIGAHTDYELFTLLRSTGPGLEVLNGAGAWIDAPPRDDAFVVNVGDMLETWSGGRFVATTHRVRKVTEERWSFPLFFSVDYATVVRPVAATDTGGVCAGDHLFAQTAQTFRYLRERMARGELVLPDGALAVDTFGQGARLATAP